MSIVVCDYCRVCSGRNVRVEVRDSLDERTVYCDDCGSATLETGRGLRIYAKKYAPLRPENVKWPENKMSLSEACCRLMRYVRR